MPKFGPISRRTLIAHLRLLGFQGPESGGNHQFMRHPDGRKIILPNPHHGDIGANLLARMLRQIGISRQDWEQL